MASPIIHKGKRTLWPCAIGLDSVRALKAHIAAPRSARPTTTAESVREVLCARCKGRDGGGLRASGGGRAAERRPRCGRMREERGQ